MLFIGDAHHMTFHWINMLPVLLSTASVASPIKLTICFYSSMRSHSFAVTAVNKKEARFCSYISLGLERLVSVGK